MPNSVVMGGRGSSVSAAAVAAGLDRSVDVDALLLKLDRIIALLSITSGPIPILGESLISGENAAIETLILSPSPGHSLVLRFSVWYDATPIEGLFEILGTDGLCYYRNPLTTAKVGIASQNTKLPIGIGCKLRLSAAGVGVKGAINHASISE